jgi:hypothetical protein
MDTNERWPEALRRYEVDGGRALLFRPTGLIPGQLFALAATGSIILLGAIGLALSAEREGSAIALAIGCMLFCLPLSQSLQWTRLEKGVDSWVVSRGVLLWRTRSRTLLNAEIATAMVVKDERGYRNTSRAGEHVRVAFGSKPFNDSPPAFDIAENLLLPGPALAGLRDVLAGERALK